MQELEFQCRHRAAKLGSVRTRLLAALQQFKQGCVHAESLGGSGPKAFKVEDRGAQECDLERKSGKIGILSKCGDQ